MCNLFVNFVFLQISYPDDINTFYEILRMIIKGLKLETTETVFSLIKILPSVNTDLILINKLQLTDGLDKSIH